MCSDGNFRWTWYADSFNDSVMICNNERCASNYVLPISAISTNTSTTLTIDTVSRSQPFDMETRWYCSTCGNDNITACDLLEIYYLPRVNDMTDSFSFETTEFGEITSVVYNLTISKVYPRPTVSIFRA
ncbi:hypothetical protein EGW08_007321, partial [Elysia chlorotica]